MPPVIVHLIDGTYELFRHFYGLRRFTKGNDRPFGAVAGVLGTVLQMIEEGATHLGVATDHVIESFRNELWSGYKTGEGIEPALLAQFHPLEDALGAMGIAVWPMIELEADDAMASAAAISSEDDRVQKVCIWTPDKDLAQCVREDRIVQVDRKSNAIRNAAGVQAKFGVTPARIPDYLALVGDSADGFPGLEGWGPKGASLILSEYSHFENIPKDWRKCPSSIRGAQRLAGVLFEQWNDAVLYRILATLRQDVPVIETVDELHWKGPRAEFEEYSKRIQLPGLYTRAKAAVKS